jgi:Mg-chelatase subunit ChlI
MCWHQRYCHGIFCVLQIGTVKDPELRVQIVSERSTFDEDPAAFHKRYAEKQVSCHRCSCCQTLQVMFLLALCQSRHTLLIA